MRVAARDVKAALLRKGFTSRESHHTYFHFIHNGRDIGVTTKLSHGEREIGSPLISRMRMQMRLPSNAAFEQFVDCALSQDAYEQILRDQGLIID